MISKLLIWSCLSINFRFSDRDSKPTKNSNKDRLFYNTVSLKKTSDHSKYTLTTKLETL